MTNEEAIAVLAEALNDVEAIDYGSAKATQMIQRKEAIEKAIVALTILEFLQIAYGEKGR